MQNLQSPVTGDNTTHRPKSGRKPLQPKNSLTEIQILKPKPTQDHNILSANESNKENHQILYREPTKTTTPVKIIGEPLVLDASLAEELSAMRKKVDRLKVEKEKTEKLLNERRNFLELKMKEMEDRCEIQKKFEIEVDRLFRLKELHSSCSMRISPIRSLREKEQEKKTAQVHWQGMKDEEDTEDLVIGGAGLHSPCLSLSSSSGSNSISSHLVAVK
ncbi:uncharacterized protein LOC126664240 [Mercurialis annua]|uniref:uncharacterized protein LOC126664240 n=1 Tax=Mercurialis annua TaxID=3986 RepID=UPI002160C274|nr:uncharacterized protein LOC126664240 [Mercurialis annua]